MRSERYRDLIPPERLRASACTVVGVGAIGRQVALQLAAMGVGRLQLIDPDAVEEVNLGPQACLHGDIGRPKVQATADLAQQLNPMLEVEYLRERFARSMDVHQAVFCCVDSIAARRLIFEAVHTRAGLFVDGRMAAEVLRVLCVHDGPGAEHYRSTLFTPGEALRESCTGRSTLYCASVAAGLMVGLWSRWVRGRALESELSLNLLGSEWAVV